MSPGLTEPGPFVSAQERRGKRDGEEMLKNVLIS
jgi:hypothetical protein